MLAQNADNVIKIIPKSRINWERKCLLELCVCARVCTYTAVIRYVYLGRFCRKTHCWGQNDNCLHTCLLYQIVCGTPSLRWSLAYVLLNTADHYICYCNMMLNAIFMKQMIE